MTTNIDNINANPWKRIKFHYLTAVAGLALVAGGAIAAGGWEGSGKSKAPATSGPTSASRAMARQADVPQVAFYLVGSQVEADRAVWFENEAPWVRFESNVPEPNRSFHILMAATKAEEEKAQLFITETTFVENIEHVGMSVIDLRGRVTPSGSENGTH